MTTLTPRYMAEVPISTLLQDFLAKNHRENDFKEHAAARFFIQLIPEDHRPMIQKVWCKNGKLFVKTDIASMKFQILTQKPTLLEKVNQSIGNEIIKELVLL